MRHPPHRPECRRLHHGAAAARRLRDRPRHHHRSGGEKMRLMTVIFLLVLLAPSARAQEIGRLFFTPQQRADLDARRKARVPDKPAAAAVASPVTRLDGYVKRSGAPSTVWINGESTTEGAPDAPRIDRGPSGSVSIGVGEAGGRIRM